ncbi:MAG: T9SS type A sorting domain-containing protein [Ignavibacteriales bacterium]
MNQRIIKYLSILLLFALVSSPALAEGVKKGSGQSLRKTSGNPNYTRLNINNLSSYFWYDGTADQNELGNSGLIYPKGSNKGIVFMSGFVWGGKVDGQVRVGGSTYQSGLQPGRILPNGQAENPDADNVRIYRVRRDYKTGSMSAEVRDLEGSEAAVRAQYAKDWAEWPANAGAPFEDVNGDGQYDPNVDIPGVPGADQTIWFVCNDLNSKKVTQLYGSTSIGIELQTTVWGYSTAGALGNMFFKKYKMINKSGKPITETHVSVWSDPDNGDAQDDFAGCDTTLSLGYVYNATNNDATYGPNPPAVGFDYFQGPLVKGAATDTGIANGRKIVGYKNLPMTAYYYFINSSPVYTDPTIGQNYEQGTMRFWNLLHGRISVSGEPFPIPASLGGGTTAFPLSGDPVTAKGYLDGELFPKGDRRIGMVSGPFTMAPSDTQEIVIAEICAGGPGTGLNNLKAVEMLKSYDKVAQQAYNDFFVLPSAPRQPIPHVTELNQEVDFDWGWDVAQVAETEGHNKKEFKFQGYNVYQLPSATATPREAVRIATYDVVDEIKYILGDVVDPATGVTLKAVQQFGNDTGLKHSIKIDKDFITNLPLVNGKKYYYAITAYAYNPDPLAVPNNLENPLSVITVIPHAPDPGVRYHSAYGDTLAINRVGGKSDGTVVPLVIDPKAVTGHDYKVTFDTLTVYNPDIEDYELAYVWKVTDVTTKEVKISKQMNQSGDDAYLNVDGLLIKVLGPPKGMKSEDPNTTDDASLWGWNTNAPTGKRQFDWSGATGLGFEGFQGGMGAGMTWLGSSVGYNALKNVVLKLAAADTLGNVDPNDPDVSYAYRYLRNATKAPEKSSFTPFMINKKAGWAYQDFKKNFPFAAYDVEDPAHPRRLAVGYLENNASGGLVDGKYWPPVKGTDNVGANSPREWFFIFDVDYKETPDAVLANDNILSGTFPINLWGSVTRRYAAAWSGLDELYLFVNHINTEQDAWTFTSKTVTVSAEDAKADVEKINVYPNPYYGANSEELNKYQKFVTFSHMPQTATIRIFNLAGQLVRTIRKDSPDQFQKWDLATDSGLPIASGIYIAYIDMPQLGKTKILKVAVIQEQQILDRF